MALHSSWVFLLIGLVKVGIVGITFLVLAGVFLAVRRNERRMPPPPPGPQADDVAGNLGHMSERVANLEEILMGGRKSPPPIR